MKKKVTIKKRTIGQSNFPEENGWPIVPTRKVFSYKLGKGSVVFKGQVPVFKKSKKHY